MRIELQAKFIQHLNNNKSKEGFTLVELLVVIIIIGILAAIALPNFLSQGAKAKQSEARQSVALVNKTQNSFRAETTGFATNFNMLAIGSISDSVAAGNGTTTNYSYTMAGGGPNTATVIASPRDAGLKGYNGGVTRYNNAGSQSVIGTVLCEMTVPGAVAVIPNMSAPTGAPTCVADTTQTALSI